MLGLLLVGFQKRQGCNLHEDVSLPLHGSSGLSAFEGKRKRAGFKP